VPSEIVGQNSEVLGKRALILLLPRKVAMAKPMYEDQLRAFWIPPFLSCNRNVVRRPNRNRSVLLRLQVSLSLSLSYYVKPCYSESGKGDAVIKSAAFGLL
jgi:hypothetical protein